MQPARSSSVPGVSREYTRIADIASTWTADQHHNCARFCASACRNIASLHGLMGQAMNVEGCTALVTGANRALGRALAGMIERWYRSWPTRSIRAAWRTFARVIGTRIWCSHNQARYFNSSQRGITMRRLKSFMTASRALVTGVLVVAVLTSAAPAAPAADGKIDVTDKSFGCKIGRAHV